MDLKSPNNIQSSSMSPRGFGAKEMRQQRRGFGAHLKKITFISIFCLILTGAVYAGLFWWRQSLNNQKLQLEQRIEQLMAQQVIDQELEGEIVATAEAIGILKSLLRQHIIASRIFKLVEKNTSVEVQWSSLNFSPPQLTGTNIQAGGLGSLSLQGTTQTYLLAGRQLRVFENMTEVKSVKLSGLSEASQGVSFSLDIQLEPELFLLAID